MLAQCRVVRNSSISLHGCRSHYGRQATNRVQHFFFSNVSSGYPNVQHAVVGGVDAISRAHAEGLCRHLFCFASARRCVTMQPHKHRATRRWFRLCECFVRFVSVSQLRERRCPRRVRTQSNAQLSLIVQCRVLRHPRPRMLRSVFRNRFARWTVVQPALVSVVLSHDWFVDVLRTSVRISVHGTGGHEARRLTVWCDRSTMWRSLDLSVVATKTLFSPCT